MFRQVLFAMVPLFLGVVAHAQSNCFPGDGNTMPCPCGNGPTGPGLGCNNSANTGGARLVSNLAGFPASLSADGVVLTASGMLPSAACIFLQSAAPNNAGSPFGDGVHCLFNPILRLNQVPKIAVGGVSSYPQAGDLSISARSAAAGMPIQPFTGRYYQVYYRDPATFACASPATYNISSAESQVWYP